VVSIVSHFILFYTLQVSHPWIGESLADQTLGNLTFFKGQRVFLDIAHANTDVSHPDISLHRYSLDHILKPDVFPNPSTVNLNRQSHLTDDGVTRTLGAELTTKIMSQMLRAVFELSGVRRRQGLEGRLKRYNVDTENTLRHEYLDADSLPTPWPSTMVLQVSTSIGLAC
jgi:linoleate 10R-lipoxygenase